MNDRKAILKNIDKGFYETAGRTPKGTLATLTEMVAPEPPQLDRIADQLWMERACQNPNLLRRGKTGPFYKNCQKTAERLYGVESLMQAAGISRDDTVEKAFFSSSNAAGTQGLFPAFLASQIIAGQLAVSLVPLLCLSEVRIGSHVQEKVTITDTTATRQTLHITEGQDIPKTSISRAQGSITLQKYARMLEATYETVRLMHLDIISLQLQRMGRQIGIDETDDLIETSIQGDGNANSSAGNANATNQGGSHVLLYADLITLWQEFPIGYEMRHMVTNDTQIAQILAMAQFQDPLAGYPGPGFNTQYSGILPGPLGAVLHRWTSTGSASIGTGNTAKILAVDDRLAIVLYREGDLLEEADQLIDKQIHRRTMSEWVGFMTWDVAGLNTLTI